MEARANEATITYVEMGKFCRNREHLHQAMLRDGWKLPSKHAAICTTQWLMKVRRKEIFCPTNSEVQTIRVCYSPPPRDILQQKLEAAIVRMEASGETPPALVPAMHALVGSLRLR